MDNKNKNISIIQFNENIKIPEFIEVSLKNKEYVGFGIDNVYPSYLLSLYNQCADHQSIIDGCVNYVMGNGIVIENNIKLENFAEKINSDGETLADIMRKAELDFQIFGGFALKLITNNFGELIELYNINLDEVRLNEELTNSYISNLWGKWGAKAIEIPLFKSDKKQKQSIYYYKGKKSRGIYPIALYNAAIKAIQTSIKISDFHLTNIMTGFNANVIINFNNGEPTEEMKEVIEESLKEKFSGTDGDKMMAVFNNGSENAVTVSRLDDDNSDEKFQTLAKSTQNTIFTSHKVTSPQLFGVKAENQGFTKTEFLESFEIYNNTVIAPLQKDLISEFTKLLSNFFVKKKKKIIPFKITTE